MPTTLPALTAEKFTEASATDYARYLQCLYFAGGRTIVAHELFLEQYPRSISRGEIQKSLDLLTKAAVPIGSPTAGN